MKILIVGLGSIAQKHIAAIKKINADAEIYALRSSISSNRQEGILDLYSNEEMLSHRFDFAIISNPTRKHKETISKLISLTIPLFIEKPLFDNIGIDEEKVLKDIAIYNIVTYVACNLRFLESLQFIKKEIENERINEVNVYCGSYLPDWRPKQDFRKVYSSNKEMGGGVHIDLIHELDYAFWLFGEPRETNSLFTSYSSLNVSAFDYANYRWQYSGFTTNVILNYYRRDSKRTLEVICENGTYVVDLLLNQVRYNNEIIFQSQQRIIDTYINQMEFFIKNILTGIEPDFNSAAQAYKILDLCLQQY